MGKLLGANTRYFNRLGNKGIDIIKFRIAQLNIHAPQYIDSVRYRFPVKSNIVRYV